MSRALATVCTCTPALLDNRTAASLNSRLYRKTFRGPGPIFGTLLKSADAKEWVAKNENMIISKGADNPIKTDTIKKELSTQFVHHYKIRCSLMDNTRFTENRADTAILSTDGFGSYLKKDTKPFYSDIILVASLKWKFIFLIWVMIIFVTMAYGPIAAFLVELFPTKIRYTSMSLPYHIGNGVFGGLVPFIATLLATTFTTDPLVGLWYPIGVAALCFVIGALYLTNKKDKDVSD